MHDYEISKFVNMNEIFYIFDSKNLIIVVNVFFDSQTNQKMKNFRNFIVKNFQKYVANFKEYTTTLTKKEFVDQIKINELIQRLNMHVIFFIMKKNKKNR